MFDQSRPDERRVILAQASNGPGRAFDDPEHLGGGVGVDSQPSELVDGGLDDGRVIGAWSASTLTLEPPRRRRDRDGSGVGGEPDPQYYWAVDGRVLQNSDHGRHA